MAEKYTLLDTYSILPVVIPQEDYESMLDEFNSNGFEYGHGDSFGHGDSLFIVEVDDKFARDVVESFLPGLIDIAEKRNCLSIEFSW